MGHIQKIFSSVLNVALLFTLTTTLLPAQATNVTEAKLPSQNALLAGPYTQYLPVIFGEGTQTPSTYPRINAPFFSGAVDYDQTGIFWFGQVDANQNYADVRIGYNNQTLWVNVASFDRRLWYKQNPAKNEIPAWDGATLYFQIEGRSGTINQKAYRFDSEMDQWEPRESGAYQAAYRGNGTSWTPAAISFSTKSGWSGLPVPNDNSDDWGWNITYEIPFASLGLSGPPVQGARWAIGVSLHDRDSQSGPALADIVWPKGMNTLQPATWGLLNFGLPSYQPPGGVGAAGQTSIRSGVNGAYVPDGMVGGNSTCGEGLDLWTTWGQKNYNGWDQANVQNEVDISDWRCFSKYYLTFPLDAVPAGKVILSAKLTLYSSGDANGFPPNEHPTTLVEISTINENWSEASINWNNAPYAEENVGRKFVDHVTVAGTPQEMDVSYAVQRAYTQKGPLRLVLYTPSGWYGSGRYFFTSDGGVNGRPVLNIVWGNP